MGDTTAVPQDQCTHPACLKAAGCTGACRRNGEAMKPSEMGNLIERLRAGATTSPDVGTHVNKYQDLCDEAADALTAALALLGEHVSAVKPDGWNEAIEAAAKCCENEAVACLGDIVPGDDIGRREANARAGALLTAAADIRALSLPQPPAAVKPDARNAALEYALKQIAELKTEDLYVSDDCGFNNKAAWIAHDALAALSQSPEAREAETESGASVITSLGCGENLIISLTPQTAISSFVERSGAFRDSAKLPALDGRHETR